VKKKLFLISSICFFLISIIYTYQTYNETNDFITIGAGYIVNLMEFSVYRANQIMLSSFIYFFSISVSLIVTMIIYKNNTNQKRVCALTIILMIVNIIVSNIYYSIYILLSIISFLIVFVAIYVSKLLWGKDIKSNEEDLIKRSSSYKDYETAKEKMDAYIYEKKLPLTSITFDTYEEEGEYFFEIYATKKITIFLE